MKISKISNLWPVLFLAQCVTQEDFSSTVPISISCKETESLLAINFAILRCDLTNQSAMSKEVSIEEIKIEPKSANAVVADADRTIQLTSQHLQKLEKDGKTLDTAAIAGTMAGFSLKGSAGAKGDLYAAAVLGAAIGVKLILLGNEKEGSEKRFSKEYLLGGPHNIEPSGTIVRYIVVELDPGKEVNKIIANLADSKNQIEKDGENRSDYLVGPLELSPARARVRR